MTDKRTEKKKETNSYPAVYGHSLNYAKEHGEVEEYKESRKLNRECKEVVEETIRQNFDGMHLKSDIVKPLVEQYGLERMTFILSNTIQQQSWDGRFSRSNKEWASKFPVEGDVVHDVDRNRELAVTSHPAVMDGFINMFRREVSELEKEPAGRTSLKARLAEKKEQMVGQGIDMSKKAKNKQRDI